MKPNPEGSFYVFPVVVVAIVGIISFIPPLFFKRSTPSPEPLTFPRVTVDGSVLTFTHGNFTFVTNIAGSVNGTNSGCIHFHIDPYLQK